MKKKEDPRHLKRLSIVQLLFAYSFSPHGESIQAEIQDIIPYLSHIDPLLQKAAPQYPLEKVAKIDVAILRYAIFEMVHVKKEPTKVIIDEAVELAKELGGEGSPTFVNGVLGTIVKNLAYE